MTQVTSEGLEFVKGITGSLANSPAKDEELNLLCPGEHDHVTLEGSNRTKQAQVYPDDQCRAMCKGLENQKQMDVMGMSMLGAADNLTADRCEHATKSATGLLEDAECEKAWGNVIGKASRPELARPARQEEC